MASTFQLYRFLGEDGVWWRLVSSNGRGLARSCVSYASVDLACEAIDAVRADPGGLELGVRLTPDYRWHWLLRRDGESVVEGIGDQDRRVRCLHAAHLFLDRVPETTVSPEPVAFRRIGPRPAAPLLSRPAGPSFSRPAS